MVCGREGEKERERKKREKKGKERKGSLSLFQSISSPAGLIPHGTLQPFSKHSPNTLPLNPHPWNPDPKMGDPQPPPHQGKGRKKRGKRTLSTHTILNFSLWGRTPRPPLLTGTRKKKTRKARARVNLTSRTKSIDLNETS